MKLSQVVRCARWASVVGVGARVLAAGQRLHKVCCKTSRCGQLGCPQRLTCVTISLLEGIP